MATKQDARTTSRAAATPARTVRAAADDSRTIDDGNSSMTLEQRRQLIRSEFVQQALPSAPPIPGYHVCWLSSTNTYDPIHKRMRMGYTPVRREEVPGMPTTGNQLSGEYADCITCNEMVLFKVPEEVYQIIMSELHYRQPLEEEQAIHARIQGAQQYDSNGKDLGEVEGDGFDSLGKPLGKDPTFA